MSESKITSRKRSNIWLHFTPEMNGGKARCDICRVLLSFTGGTTSNLAKHLRAKHPSVVDDIQPKRASLTRQRQSVRTDNSSTSAPASATTSSSNSAKEHVGESSTANQQPTTKDNDSTVCIQPVKNTEHWTHIVWPACVSCVARQKRLNDLLLKVHVTDFQPWHSQCFIIFIVGGAEPSQLSYTCRKPSRFADIQWIAAGLKKYRFLILKSF